MRFLREDRGFTLVEMIGAIAIIAIILSVVLFNIQAAKEKARDTERIAEINQLHAVLRAYVDVYGKEINCRHGLKIDGQSTYNPATDTLTETLPVDCPNGQAIIDFIKENMGVVPADPLGPGNPDYYYYYDPVHACQTAASGDTSLLFAVNLEEGDSNVLEVCSVISGTNGGFTATNVFPGGTISPNKQYVKVLGESAP